GRAAVGGQAATRQRWGPGCEIISRKSQIAFAWSVVRDQVILTRHRGCRASIPGASSEIARRRGRLSEDIVDQVDRSRATAKNAGVPTVAENKDIGAVEGGMSGRA